MIKYIVAGLPRSGTTWLSVFLTTDSQVCLHDPSARYSPEELSSWQGGIADTGLWYYPDWCKENTDKFIIVDRNIAEVNINLAKRDLPLISDKFYYSFLDSKKEANYVVYFEALFTEEACEDLWRFVHPELPFNKERWELLKDIYISPLAWEKENDLN